MVAAADERRGMAAAVADGGVERDADDQGTGGQDEGGGESNFGSGGEGDAASSQEKLGEEQNRQENSAGR